MVEKYGNSAVGAILDPWGGFRVVVSEFCSLQQHVAKNELCIVVPDPYGIKHAWLLNEEWVKEFDHWPIVVRTAELYVEHWIKTRNDPEDLKHPCVATYLVRTARNKAAQEAGGTYHSIHIPDLARPTPRHALSP